MYLRTWQILQKPGGGVYIPQYLGFYPGSPGIFWHLGTWISAYPIPISRIFFVYMCTNITGTPVPS